MNTQTPLILSLRLWPHRSMPARGLIWVTLVAVFGLSLPLAPLIFTAQFNIFWVLCAHACFTLILLISIILLTYRSARVEEIVELWPDLLRIRRRDANGKLQIWEAHPHWVNIRLYDTPRLKRYLVLSASGRAVELGAFLTPDERKDLAQTLRESILRRHAAVQ